jgi:aspartate/methionine/tyrosine aminotransferase
MLFADRIQTLLSFSPPDSLKPKVRQAIEEALDRGETHYTDRPGILPLRQAVSASLQRRFSLAMHDVIITCGVTEARFITIQQVLQPGQTITAPVCGERIRGAAVLRRVQVGEVEAQALYLASSSGEATLRGYIEAAPSAAWILYEVDEEQSRFHPAQLAGCDKRTFTLGTLGQPSLRVGYLAAPAAFSAGLRDFKQALTICTTNLSQWAALAGLETDEDAG